MDGSGQWLEQQFHPAAPNQDWVVDMTYIPTDEGWLYPAGVEDVFTCEIAGYAMREKDASIERQGALACGAQQAPGSWINPPFRPRQTVLRP